MTETDASLPTGLTKADCGTSLHPFIPCEAIGYFDQDPANPEGRFATWACFKNNCPRPCKKTAPPLPIGGENAVKLCTC